MKVARTEARNIAAWAMSVGLPSRLRGIFRSIAAANSGMNCSQSRSIKPPSITPSATEFTRIPNRPASWAIPRIKASIPALGPVDKLSFGACLTNAAGVVTRYEPPPCSRIRGNELSSRERRARRIRHGSCLSMGSGDDFNAQRMLAAHQQRFGSVVEAAEPDQAALLQSGCCRCVMP